MTFLNPLYLFGLVLATIPPLIHLLSQRRLQKIPFSSLTFLKSVEKTRARWWRVRQLLLLIIRTLAICLFALSLARPVLRGISLPGLGLSSPASVAIILDNSFSMERGGLFQTAKAKTLKLIDGLSRGDIIHLIYSSDHPYLPLDEPTHDLTLLRKAVAGAKLSSSPTDHLPTLKASESWLRRERTLNRVIWLLTDLQKLGFESVTSEALELAPGIDLNILRVGEADDSNLSVEEIELLDELLIPQENVKLRVGLKNHGDSQEKSLVGLFVDGVRKAQVEAKLAPGEVLSLPFSYRIESLGDQNGVVELADPSLTPDNQRFFSLYVPKRIRVLLVDGSNSGKESYYLERALSPGEDMVTFFQPEPIPWDELPHKELSRYGVVALLNGRDLSQEVVQRLRRFVEEGGGLFIALGDRVEPQSYRQFLSDLFGLSLRDIPPGRVEPSKFLTISEADYSSPILSPFRDPEKGDLSLPKYYRVYPVRGGKVLARLSDGSPLLVEGGDGLGRAILSTVPLSRRWSDLPLKAIFLPLVHRVFSYLSKERGGELSTLVGEELSLELKGHPRSLKLLKPEGEAVPMRPQVGVGSISLELRGLDSPGIYRVLADEEVVASFSVNLDPRESDLSRITQDELKELLPEARLIGPEDPLELITRRSFGSELRGPFLLLALLLLIGEMVIATRRV